MKNQINTLNITGAAVSASLMVLLYFLPTVNLSSFTKRRSVAKTQKTQSQQLPKLRRYKKPLPPTLVDTYSSPSLETQNEENESTNQPESTEQTTLPQTQEPKAPQEIAEIETQKQDLECTKLEDTPQRLSSKSNGCPKNLDYYTMKPRPKQTPEECITCKNLIDCVCQTSN
jgi:hypothetical protein